MLFLRVILEVVVSICLFVCLFFYLLEIVPMLYDNNTYSRMYVAVSILDCSNSPWEPKGRGSKPQNFDSKIMLASFPNNIKCLKGDPEDSNT